MQWLNAENARIFRITHINNVPWILAHGLHCRSSHQHDPDFVSIGSAELIGKRANHPVRCGPGGTLADYVPFYFTPKSIMLYNISTGHGGIVRQANRDIVILTSSIPALVALDLPFVFYDGHAYMHESTCYSSVDDLDKIDWPLLRSKNFSNDPEDPGKKSRYQAEALVYRSMPATALIGIACYNPEVANRVAQHVAEQGLEIPVKALPEWYF